jgi:[FeFe] hydrogenase H-cluster maturation GTPase HydF
VLFIDTPGSDDEGTLGDLRVARTRAVFDRVDAAVLVADIRAFGEAEDALLTELARRAIPVIVALNKADLASADTELLARLAPLAAAVVPTSATRGDGIDAIRAALVASLRADAEPRSLLGDLVPPGQLCVMVVPIDPEAPRGRLILPQVQAIRDVLDHDAMSLVVKERELRAALAMLKSPPALVVTDSQAFLKVAADTPPEVPLTSFSILMARAKGDLDEFVRGCVAIESLHPGDKVLVAEACTHHPAGEDIGRVKIPRWLTRYVGGPLDFEFASGTDFPADLHPYQLVVHCGSCMINRRTVLSRIARCRQQDVPVANYGMTIAYSLGILERALEPFPSALDTYNRLRCAARLDA